MDLLIFVKWELIILFLDQFKLQYFFVKFLGFFHESEISNKIFFMHRNLNNFYSKNEILLRKILLKILDNSKLLLKISC